MDDQTRHAALTVELAKARESVGAIGGRLRAFAANLSEIRAVLGNPFYYSGRPESDPHSEAHFTGYAGNDAALMLLRELRDARIRIAAIEEELSQIH
jgi:hypothetical protein